MEPTYPDDSPKEVHHNNINFAGKPKFNKSTGGLGLNRKIILKWILDKSFSKCEVELRNSDRMKY